jgi:hypothetical protein
LEAEPPWQEAGKRFLFSRHGRGLTEDLDSAGGGAAHLRASPDGVEYGLRPITRPEEDEYFRKLEVKVREDDAPGWPGLRKYDDRTGRNGS